MLWKISGALILLWLLSFISHRGGWLIHPILASATVVFLVNWLMQHDPESSWA